MYVILILECTAVTASACKRHLMLALPLVALLCSSAQQSLLACGFINLHVRDICIVKQLNVMSHDPALHAVRSICHGYVSHI